MVMPINDLIMQSSISITGFATVYLLVRYGFTSAVAFVRKQADKYDLVLNKQLLLDVNPYTAMGAMLVVILFAGASTASLMEGPGWFVVGAGIAMFIPGVMLKHLADKRRKKLEEQLVDGITSLASGVRAGLNLVQSFELLVENSIGPIKQEVQQMLHEYNLGVDLATAMKNTSDRIGSSHYRLLFSAIQAHRVQGGDMSESLDRIAESIREIQRLEGKLDSLTAQGRAQARMMGAMPFVIMAIMYGIDQESTSKLLTEPMGRLILLGAGVVIAIGFYWIKKIMEVDI